MDTRKKLYQNIIISGANTMFPGFSSRLEAEIIKQYKQKVLKDVGGEVKIKLEIVDSPRRNFSVFIGACFLAKLYEDQPGYWISKEEWEENGSNIIYKKCQNLMI
jgi:actin-related protein 2